MMMQGGRGATTLQATGVELKTIINALSQSLGRPVVDKTDLKPGLYDMKLQWTNSGPGGAGIGGPPGADSGAAPTEPEGASIFTAIQEQLGLRLVSTKGPVEVLVIDSVQKPVLE